MSTYRRNEGMFQAAKMLLADAERIAAKRKEIKERSRQPERVKLAMDKALAKTQRHLEADALALETDGMNPTQRARWIRHRKVVPKKDAETK